jgi:predicted DNA-binding transcriptional regulator AlpA
MKNTLASSKFENLSLDWMSENPATSFVKKALPMTPDATAFAQSLWPMSSEFQMSIQNLHLIQVMSLEQCNSSTFWLVKDGLLPTIWFFKRFPRPQGLQSRLLFHVSLKRYIPEAWTDHVGLYGVYNQSEEPLSTKSKSGEIFITGLVSDFYFPSFEVESFFDQLRKHPEANSWKQKKIKVMLPLRLSHHPEANSLGLQFMAQLCETFGTDMQAISYVQLRNQEDFTGDTLIDLNTNHILTYTEVLHHTMSRGIRVIGGQTELTEVDQAIPLSSYHGLNLKLKVDLGDSIYNQVLKSYKEVDQYYRRYVKAVESSSNLNFPWPQWFSDWVQAGAKSEPTAIRSVEVQKAKKK